MSLRDVICVAGDVRPFKADDILDTPAMRGIAQVLRNLEAHLIGVVDIEVVASSLYDLPESVFEWINPPQQPEQLELPEEFRWKLREVT